MRNDLQQEYINKIKSARDIGIIFSNLEEVYKPDITDEILIPLPDDEIWNFASTYSINFNEDEMNAWLIAFGLLIRKHIYTYDQATKTWELNVYIKTCLNFAMGDDWQNELFQRNPEITPDEINDCLIGAYASYAVMLAGVKNPSIMDIDALSRVDSAADLAFQLQRTSNQHAPGSLRLSMLKKHEQQPMYDTALEILSRDTGYLSRIFANEKKKDAGFRKKRPDPSPLIKNHFLALTDEVLSNTELRTEWANRYLYLVVLHLCEDHSKNGWEFNLMMQQWLEESLGENCLNHLLYSPPYREASMTKEDIFFKIIYAYASTLFMENTAKILRFDPNEKDDDYIERKKNFSMLTKSIQSNCEPAKINSIIEIEYKKKLQNLCDIITSFFSYNPTPEEKKTYASITENTPLAESYEEDSQKSSDENFKNAMLLQRDQIRKQLLSSTSVIYQTIFEQQSATIKNLIKKYEPTISKRFKNFIVQIKKAIQRTPFKSHSSDPHNTQSQRFFTSNAKRMRRYTEIATKHLTSPRTR